MFIRPLFTAIIILGFLLPVFSQNEVLLEYRPPKEMKFITIYHVENSNEQEVMGIVQKVEMNSVIETESVVLESKANSTLLSVSYKRLRIETISPAVDFSIDTDTKEEQPGLKYLKALTNKPFRISINRNGEIDSIAGLDEVMQNIIAEVDTNSSIFSQFKTTIHTFFDEEQIKNNLNQMNPIFPETKVGIGDSWNYQLGSIAGQFEFISTNNSKVIDIQKDKVILQIDSKVSVPEHLSKNFQDVNAIIDLKGSEVSEVGIDIKTGITMQGIKKQNINAIMRLDMSEQGQDNIQIPMKINTSTEINVTLP
ncbi:MAG: DUF6263 family protein [Bacteroidota bacterium]